MKAKSLLFSVLIILLCGLAPIDVENCKVLIPNLSGTYSGDCKKGLAHGNGKATGIDSYEGKFKKGLPDGKGTYTWKNGDVYTGDWLKGMQNGEGQFNTRINNIDTTIVGIWENNEYIGAKTLKPKVIRKEGIQRVKFVRTEGRVNQMCVILYKNGDFNRSVSDFNISGDSGVQLARDQIACFENFEIPFRSTVRYKSEVGLSDKLIYVFLEFDILQEGSWEVSVYN